MDQTGQTPQTIQIKIDRLDIAESYFSGLATMDGRQYKINIQGHWQDKLIKLPRYTIDSERVLARFTGENDAYIEDYLVYQGASEWIEIDSDIILHYIADHQDQLDTLEIVSSGQDIL